MLSTRPGWTGCRPGRARFDDRSGFLLADGIERASLVVVMSISDEHDILIPQEFCPSRHRLLIFVKMRVQATIHSVQSPS